MVVVLECPKQCLACRQSQNQSPNLSTIQKGTILDYITAQFGVLTMCVYSGIFMALIITEFIIDRYWQHHLYILYCYLYHTYESLSLNYSKLKVNVSAMTVLLILHMYMYNNFIFVGFFYGINR